MSTKDERRALLRSELNKAGLQSLENVMKKLRHLSETTLSGEDAHALVDTYLKRGYPTLEGVMKLVTPKLREMMLQEHDCWIENSSRCLAFLAGSEEFPDINAVKTALLQERRERRKLLEEELRRQSLPVTSGAVDICSFQNDDAFVDECIGRSSWAIHSAATAFIKEGTGNPHTITHAAAAEVRRKELVSVLRAIDVEVPRDLQAELLYKNKHTESTQDFRSYQRLDKVGHQPLASFIFGDTEGLDATAAAEKYHDEKKKRREAVETWASEYSLDLQDLERSYRYRSLFHKLDKYVEDGVEAGKRTLAIIACEEGLKKLGFPGREALCRKSYELKERLDAAVDQTGGCVQELLQNLADERSNRCDQASRAAAKQVEYGQELLSLASPEENQIKRSDFVQFGVGSVEATVASVQESIRRDRLQQAMSAAVPALSSPDLPSRLNTDKRLVEFIKGKRNFANEQEVASKLQEEERFRVAEVEELLAASKFDSVAVSQLPKRHRLRLYIAEGVGSSKLLVDETVKESREDNLRRVITASGLTMSFYYKALKTPQCKDFIEGTSIVTCEALVSSWLENMAARKQHIQDAIRSCDEREETLYHCDYYLKRAVDDYIEFGSETLEWIRGAIKYHSRLRKAVSSCGTLKDILPKFSISEANQSRLELKEDLLVFTRGIVDSQLRAIAGEASYHATRGLGVSTPSPVEMSQIILNHVLSFCEPTYDEAVRYGLAQQYDAPLDHRLVLLLTCPIKCPWNNAEEAVLDLRQERRTRLELFDKEFPQGRYARVHLPWRSSIVYTDDDPHDKEDRVWHDSDPRADYINGKICLEEALNVSAREERNAMLEEALRSASLNESLATKNQDCVDFVDGPQTSDDPEEFLFRLITKLQGARAERTQLLNQCFLNASVIDTCASEYSDLFDFDSDNDEDYYDGYLDDEHFPDNDEVCRIRAKYIELGQGKPEEVLRTFVMFKRTQILERAVEKSSSLQNLRCHASDWMRGSKKCKDFVAKTEAGLPSEQDVDDFIKILEAMRGSKGKAKEYDHESESDDERSSYCGRYDDDDYGGGNDWKYHLSGGDYGNDPDTDAMWDAYWDC